MTLTPPVKAGMSKITDTGVNGFAEQNGTPNIGAVWNVPNDGAAHSFIVIGQVHCTVAATGGVINVTYTQPDGNPQTTQLDPGSRGVGTFGLGSGGILSRQVQPGSTVQISQGSALTAGTVQLFAALWGA
jgi:hypothetical protein